MANKNKAFEPEPNISAWGIERHSDYPVTEYERAILKIGWSQVRAARILGIDPRTSRRYIRGELQMPAPLRILLRILVRVKATEIWLDKMTKDEIK